jgi:hypothetical protein
MRVGCRGSLALGTLEEADARTRDWGEALTPSETFVGGLFIGNITTLFLGGETPLPDARWDNDHLADVEG